jgi:hypothetical protein
MPHGGTYFSVKKPVLAVLGAMEIKEILQQL